MIQQIARRKVVKKNYKNRKKSCYWVKERRQGKNSKDLYNYNCWKHWERSLNRNNLDTKMKHCLIDREICRMYLLIRNSEFWAKHLVLFFPFLFIYFSLPQHPFRNLFLKTLQVHVKFVGVIEQFGLLLWLSKYFTL
jgi:hypothetical protein